MKKPVAAALIFLVAAAAAGGVLLFMNGVRERAEAGRITADVIVATRDIPAGQELSVLIDEGVFRTKSVDVEDLVPGAITDVYQLQGRRNRSSPRGSPARFRPVAAYSASPTASRRRPSRSSRNASWRGRSSRAITSRSSGRSATGAQTC